MTTQYKSRAAPTPMQIEEWREEALTQYFDDDNIHVEDIPEEHYVAGYVLARTEQATEIAELKDDLQFVERWAVHHGTKPHMTPENALSVIQHYPAITTITKSYTDGKVPDTFNPYAEIAELKAQLAELKETRNIVSLTSHNNHDFITELMPLARFGARMHDEYFDRTGWYFGPAEFERLSSLCNCHQTGEFHLEYAPNIESTIEQLLKD